MFSVTFLQLLLLDADDDVRVARGAGLKSGIWICGRALRRRRAGGDGALTTASIVRDTLGLSRILRCLVRASLSFRDIGYRVCFMGWRSLELGLVIGPVHSVITDGTINGGSASLAYPLPLLMLGANFSVALRASRDEDINPSMLLGSRHSLRGLLGGGGPGLSEKLLTPIEAAILGVLCSSTGWLPIRLGDGCLISTSLPGRGNLTGNSSCGRARRGTGVPDGDVELIR